MKVFVTRNIPSAGLDKLREAGHAVIVSGGQPLTPTELAKKLKASDPDAVLCLLTDRIDSAVFDAAPRAKIFANYAVGFDNLDLEEAARRKIIITNTPDVLTEAVAEHTVALVLALARRVSEGDRFVRAGRYEGWDPLLLIGTELKHKTLGIVGSGRIGARVAEIMRRGFGLTIIYYDRERNIALESSLDAAFKPQLDELLALADIVSVHLPLTPETHHLFNQNSLAKMKLGALLVNTARGAIIDEADLAEAIKTGVIGGAALDVFEAEPQVEPALLSLDNVIVTPHIASATHEARERMSLVAASNIIAVLSGQAPLNPVDVIN